jgi:hypothetical protein
MMGLGIFKPSGCECGGGPGIVTRVVEKIVEKILPNPDPHRFNIIRIEQHDSLLIALINYPNATNYEGNKILVFENIMESQFRKEKFIDPHFCPCNHISPIARFEPTDRGWQMAQDFANTWLQWR